MVPVVGPASRLGELEGNERETGPAHEGAVDDLAPSGRLHHDHPGTAVRGKRDPTPQRAGRRHLPRRSVALVERGHRLPPFGPPSGVSSHEI